MIVQPRLCAEDRNGLDGKYSVLKKARCKPEIKTNKLYELKLSVEVVGGDGIFRRAVKCVTFAECSCPAGKAPFASCKDFVAFFYALEDFCKLGLTRNLVTCTEELQTWNKPYKKVRANASGRDA